MSFMYPRTIAVTRPQGPTGVGYQGYSAAQIANEVPVISGIPASVQAKTTLSRAVSGALPASPPGPVVWRIFIADGLVADGQILDRDIITDDLGRRFQVEADYVNSMGWNIPAIKLEAR